MTNPQADPQQADPQQADQDRSPAPSRRRIPVAVATVLVGAVAGLVAIHGLRGMGRAGGDPACRAAVELAGKIAPLAQGEVAAVTMANAPLKLPELSFRDAEGKERKLSDWRGKTVLLNLWATWCVPCRKEMPALDGLAARLAGPNFDVVAVNIDTRDPDKPKKFLRDAGLSRLDYYTDENAKVFQDLKSVGRALGMPTSVLVDPNGCEIGTIAGPAEWNSSDAIKLIKAALPPAAARL